MGKHLISRMFPFCCTGAVVANFGETEISSGNHNKTDEAIIARELYITLDDLFVLGKVAFVSATTNNQQKTANKLLKLFEFNSSGWLPKEHHPETKIRLWWISAEQWKGLKLSLQKILSSKYKLW